jgi:DNA-binding transcriptional ArsR family regulator
MALTSDQLSNTFAALADPTRRAILARLVSGERSVTELAAPFDMSMPAVSKHLRVLERAGLLRRERAGWYHHCHLQTRPLEDAVAFIARYQPFWERTLEELARYVEQPAPTRRRKP